jgi:Lrp/AsnC family leucine-responsive transcriptional regulator
MDDLDRKIIRLMMQNARMPVKEIAEQINLTSPAVSSRIHRLEQQGIIGGYTLILHHPEEETRVQALISVATDPAQRPEFLDLVQNEPQILQCYRVTGSYNFIAKVSCPGIDSLEHLLTRIQKTGSTNTQIILATQVDRPLMY